MDVLTHFLIRVLMGLFAVGVAGCLVVIPLVAFKFASVLFTPDPTKSTADAQQNAA